MAGMGPGPLGLVVILTPVSLFIARFIASKAIAIGLKPVTRSDQAQRVEETIRRMALPGTRCSGIPS